MKILSNTNLGFILVILTLCMAMNSFAQEIPLVYDNENTGADCAKPPLPGIADLPLVRPLTDPFEWADGSGRDTTFASWECRRSEIKAEIENYEIGVKPDRPDSITASFNWADSVLTVNVTVNDKTLTLNSRVILPEGDGPFPAVIGMAFFPGGSGTGSLPSSIFTSRHIAGIEFVHDQVTAYSGPGLSDPYYQLYPDQNLNNSGQYSAWSWGVSRLIDGLELVRDVLPIDLKHLAVTGCSYAGKMALFAGAFDERIALTIAQESGGGGAPAWRVSETLGNVETLSATSHSWFRESMFNFAGNNTAKLPYDHHELMAMCAPRALLVTGNTNFEWLANPSCYVSARATQRVYNTLGIGDRFGFYIDGGHGHCAVPESQVPAISKFVDKFLLGDTTVDTDIEVNPYPNVNYSRWTEWWGKGESYFPEQFIGVTVTLEAECGTLGSDWVKGSDNEASNEAYVVSKSDRQVTTKGDIDAASTIEIPFSVDTVGNYGVFVRMNNPTSDNDSYWIRMDDNNFTLKLSLGTDGWEWKKLAEYELTPGDHTVYLSYRENGGWVDKFSISSYLYYEPEGLDDNATNLCDPKVGVNSINEQPGYSLGQNYPNPFSDKTAISFSIPENTYVSLKVYDIRGHELMELAGKDYAKGENSVEFDAHILSKGVYFYTLKTDQFTSTRKMILGQK